MIDPKTGAIVFSVPEGEHDIAIRFEDTPIRKLANRISAVSAFIMMFFAFWAVYGQLRRLVALPHLKT